jgi:CHASE3 domain sensor protein
MNKYSKWLRAYAELPYPGTGSYEANQTEWIAAADEIDRLVEDQKRGERDYCDLVDRNDENLVKIYRLERELSAKENGIKWAAQTVRDRNAEIDKLEAAIRAALERIQADDDFTAVWVPEFKKLPKEFE